MNIFIILGFVALLLAIAIILFKIDELTVGKHVSRFIATLIIAMGYYYYAVDIAGILPWGITVTNEVLIWSVRVILFLVAVFNLFKVIKGWKEAGGAILKKASLWLVLAVALLIATRFLFAAGSK